MKFSLVLQSAIIFAASPSLWLGCWWLPCQFSFLFLSFSSFFFSLFFKFLLRFFFSLCELCLQFSREFVSPLSFMSLFYSPPSPLTITFQTQNSTSPHLFLMPLFLIFHSHLVICSDLRTPRRIPYFPPPQPACRISLEAKCSAVTSKVRVFYIIL